jgi:hypothetical protein
MSMVEVIDQQQRPCNPVHPGRARHLLMRGRAAVYRRFPFTIILKEGEPSEEPEPLRLKIDPGSKTTGLAVVNDASGQVVWAAELTHRGQQVKRASTSAAGVVAAASGTPALASHGFSTASSCWLAATLVGVAQQQHAHLGGTVAPVVSGGRHQPRAGQIRHPVAAERRDQWSGIPTGRVGGL